MAELKTIRFIPFSGKTEDWNRWSKTFLATATAKGYREVIKPNDPSTKAEPDLNIQVYNDLILSCQDDITFGIVDESISSDFPEGDARLAWKNLQDRFEPSTGAAKVQLKQEFHQLKLGSVDEDPDIWITELELKRRRLKNLGTTIEDDDLILHILNHLPKEYETVVELCEEDLSRGNINLGTVKERIRARFNRLQKASADSEGAIALMMKSQFKGACTVCGKIGHKGPDCFTLERNKAKKEEYFKKLRQKRANNNKHNNHNKNNNKGKGKPKNDEAESKTAYRNVAMAGLDDEMILIANDAKKFSRHTWVADSGATIHMTNDLEGMFDLEDSQVSISVGDGRKMTTMKVGKYRGTLIDANGNQTKVVLTNVSYVPELMVSLFSLTAAMERNFSVVGTKDGIEIEKGPWKVKFNQKFGTPKGHVFGATIVPQGGNEFVNMNVEKQFGYEMAHQLLGHPGRNKLISTSERLEWTLTARSGNECEDCLRGKARRMNVNKESKNRATMPGERLMIDISSVKTPNNKKVGRFWLLVMDEATDMKWSFFLKNKSQQVPLLLGFIKNLKEMNKPVKFIRCDNAGENYSFQKKIEEEGMNIKFEFTARQTPQQNGKVERAFATLYGRMRAMMISAKFSAEMKQQLWMEAAATATKLDNILNEKGEPSPHKKFFNDDPEYEKYLRTFGELGVVTSNPGGTIKSKLEDRGITSMFLGYAANHAGNVYRMLNLKTNKVLITRDVKWLKTFREDEGRDQRNQEDDDDDLQVVPTRQQEVITIEGATQEANDPQEDLCGTRTRRS